MATIDEIFPGVFKILFKGVRACYLLRGPRNTLIDCGVPSDAPELIDVLQQQGLKPRELHLLLLTHVHADHCGCAGYLPHWYPDLTIGVHESAVRHLRDPRTLSLGIERVYKERSEEIGKLIKVDGGTEIVALKSGTELDLGAFELTVIETPGHARHHVAFWEPNLGCVFCGDALGSRYPGLPSLPLTPPSDFSPDLAKRSIDRIRLLDPRVLCLTHNGPNEVSEHEGLFDELKEQIDRWVELLAGTLRARPQLEDREALDIFLEAQPELGLLDSQRFSLGMSVSGILGHLRRVEEPWR